MRKIFIFFGILLFFRFVDCANFSEGSEILCKDSNCGCQKGCEKECQKNDAKSSCDEKKYLSKDKEHCLEFEVDDDEYCTFNQCFFDRQYRQMKKNLCLTRRQEMCLDNLYLDFKSDMEELYLSYCSIKNDLLQMIECENSCYKEKADDIVQYKKDAKEKYDDFMIEVKETLTKNQISDFKKFKRNHERKVKKILKYSIVYKFPCENKYSK